ncbi:MAG: DUF998 domain-containing protein [Methanobrevibacter sp.]|nr:DUF998 domain-containing protein [Methanobrevibacter sp.]
MKTENTKYGSYAFIIAGIYFLLSELASAVSTGLPLFEVYTQNTISALGVPGHISPIDWLMNSGFIVLGVLLIIGFHMGLSSRIKKWKAIEYALTFVTALGLFIIAAIHAGNPIHQIGALMAIVGGGVLLMTAAFALDTSKSYKIASFSLGLIAILFLIVMIIFMGNPQLEIIEAIPERISVYALILWSFLTGVYLIKNN